MVIINHAKNIQRIIDVLKSNKLTFEKNIPGKTRQINFGDPHDKLAEATPYSYVTVPESLLYTHWQYGTSANQNQASVKYEIVIVSKSQKELLQIIQNYQTVLSADHTFADVTNTPPVDPIFEKSVISDVTRESRNGLSGRGGLIEIGVITLTAQIGSNAVLSIGDIVQLQDIPILDKPDETHIKNTQNIYNTARVRKGVATVNESHTFFAKVEYSRTIWEELHNLLQSHSTVSFSVTRGDDTQTRKGVITNMNNGAGYDEVETILFQIEIF